MPAQQITIDSINRRAVIDTINAAFSTFDPTYLDSKRIAAIELDQLTQRLLSLQERERNPLYRSQQIVLEAEWLLHYTCDWNRLQRRLHDLRLSLCGPQRRTADQSTLVAGKDGAFGAGCTEWFHKWDNTTDAVQSASVVPAPLTFLKPILSPGRLLAYLHRLQVSDIAGTGVNRRGELASVQSSMLQFLIKPRMRFLLTDPALWDKATPDEVAISIVTLSQTFEDFLDQSQHPRTGYWGPWYILGGELIKMHDLSFTFHIVNFRRGKVDRWPEILATTLLIGQLGLEYPYGWRPSDSPSRYSNHHNTDVVTLFWYGRDHATAGQQEQIAQAILGMLDWCLTHSLRPDVEGNAFGDFAPVDEDSTIERYAFGVSFLKLAGYWRPTEDFWWDPRQPRSRTWPEATIVATHLLAAVERLGSASPYVEDIREVLRPLAGRDEAVISAGPGV